MNWNILLQFNNDGILATYFPACAVFGKSKQFVLFIIHLQLRKKLSSTHQGKVKILVLNSG